MRSTIRRALVGVAVVVGVAFIFHGCGGRVEITDAMVKGISIGSPIDQVLETLGPPHSRGRKVTLTTEGSITKEYPRKAEACLWEGEHTYVLVFMDGHLVEKNAYMPDLTEVSVTELPEADIRDADTVRETITKLGLVYDEIQL